MNNDKYVKFCTCHSVEDANSRLDHNERVEVDQATHSVYKKGNRGRYYTPIPLGMSLILGYYSPPFHISNRYINLWKGQAPPPQVNPSESSELKTEL